MKRVLAPAAVTAALLGAAHAGSASPPEAVPVRAVADELARGVPLPAGGNFAGIRWEQAGGTFTHQEILAILHYNAACQWLRAWRDGRAPEAALDALPSWSAWHGGEAAAVLAAVVDDVRSGGELSAGVLRDCDASHAREIEYARSLGRKPSA